MKIQRALSLGALAFALAGCAARAPAPVTTVNAGATGAPAPAAVTLSDDVVSVAEVVVIDAPIEQIWSVFDDPEAYRHVLPLVRSLTVRGRADDGSLLIELTQGLAIASGSYTARIRKVRPYVLEMGIDHAFPSILRDGRGEVELTPEPDGKTRVAYRMTADLGDSWILSLFKNRVRGALVKPPYLLKMYVEGRR